ncbi:MAG: D-arabinose 5-phosphate isomerase [Gammaproteobacteria bacterium]|jgi:arabinose-5-phosphate isomerase|nr:D-arabinose 5-phosphate isomerase [Gammaproteobacteria bacterium]
MSFQARAQEVIRIELEAIKRLQSKINESFDQACNMLKVCTGRIVVLGMGKSGHIGNKIAATLASTGSPAFSIHAAEASHGDFGMITNQDVIIAISYSGKTAEVLSLLPLMKRLNIPVISITGDPNSPLAKAATINLDVSVDKEACPLGLAPTASTTATLVMGDAIAIALLQEKGFTAKEFAFSHPGGSLGKRLLLTARDLMHSGEEIPIVKPDANLQETILEITRKKLGMTAIVDADTKLLGIFTDGDLRRAFEKGIELKAVNVLQVMTKTPKTVKPDSLAIEALNIMENYKITSLVVADEQNHVVGILHMHDLLQAGI